MKTQWLKNIILLALMLAASAGAVALRPTHKIADQGPKVDLETMIPRAFADWREVKQSSIQIVDPQQKEEIDKIYSQTLNRTYVNHNGYQIMLALAYGTDQNDSNMVHRPEVCYPAQGFQLESKQNGSLALDNGSIPVVHILATLGQLSEPVTYWTTLGNQVLKPGGVQKKLLQLSYGLAGKIPDGMLIRVSSIDPETNNAFEIQKHFSAEMLSALTPEHRQKLTGALQPNP